MSMIKNDDLRDEGLFNFLINSLLNIISGDVK